MPRAPPTPPFPLNGLFPIAKPSGPTSMKVIDKITPLLLDSKLFHDPQRIKPANDRKRKKNYTHMGLKIGQGGTLDPLADGVLVIGVNRGTKHLSQFLACTKEYESTGLLGAATTTYDSEGPILNTAKFDGITREQVEGVLDKFRGDITQVPPIFSALKMDGKPLYEYARESKPLPRAIPVRPCTVSIDLMDFQEATLQPGDGGHEFKWPSEHLSEEEKQVFAKLTEMVKAAEVKEEKSADVPVPDLKTEDVPEVSAATGLRPATFKVKMTVSSGTYVRSIVHDIGLALGCAAHVVTLTRTRQGQFSLYGDEEVLGKPIKEEEVKAEEQELTEEERAMAGDSEAVESGPSGGSIPWAVWERALEERQVELEKFENLRQEALANGESPKDWNPDAIAKKRRELPLREWEQEVLKRFVSVPVPVTGSHNGGPVYARN